jgi:fructosamine-3-kinase
VSALPAALVPPVRELLRKLGDPVEIQSARPVTGGCINHALRVDTEKRSYLLKWNASPLPGMFLAEASGLSMLAQTHTVRVPEVYGFGEAEQDRPAYILLEWLEGGEGARGQQALGEQLAELHRQGIPHASRPTMDWTRIITWAARYRSTGGKRIGRGFLLIAACARKWNLPAAISG